MALTHPFRRAASGRGDEKLLLGRRRAGGGIGDAAIGKFRIAAAHESEPRAIPRQREIGQLLPVILSKRGDRARRPTPRRDPDVTHAARIFDPGKARRIGRPHQPARNRQSQGRGQIIGHCRLSQ
ncbi:hypothetical protein D9M73_114200 [compost metagenome]